MPSNNCGQAIADVLRHGKALLKFISANDCGATRAHQAGFYLPKSVWQLFTPHPPVRGRNSKHKILITWPDDQARESVVTWYGKRTRSEYRLTRFGKDFHWLTADMVGSLLVLVPKDDGAFVAHVLESDGDIADMQASLGLEIRESWAIYPAATIPAEGSDACIRSQFLRLVGGLDDFPNTTELSAAARQALDGCVPRFGILGFDDQLVALVKTEYTLFKLIEDKLCREQVKRGFDSIDGFIGAAASLMNRRKARAGRSLENHFSSILRAAKVPFDQRVRIDGRVEPDILIPGKKQYEDQNFPSDKLFLLGLKTTCKDRWRQVLNEGRRVKIKHILTLQEGISAGQLNEMHESGVALIVPEPLQKFYPGAIRGRINILSVNAFVSGVTQKLG